MRKSNLAIIWLASFVLIHAFATDGGAAQSKTSLRPNILFILVNDMGYGDASCFGGVGVKTPNIDRLAAQGTRFDQFYVASPICSPSRVAFTTGMGPALPAGTPRWKTTILFIERTLDFISRQKAAGKPFYVNLWFSEVPDAHVPRPEDADPKLKDTTAKKKKGGGYPQNLDAFRRTLTGFDRDLRKLLEGLRELELEDNTLVIFTGDNGPNPLYDTAHRVRTAGLRGQKWSLSEGGIREPFIVRWPGHVPAGKVNRDTVLASVDFFPLFCHIAGVNPPSGAEFDGENQAAALLGEARLRTKPLFWEYGRSTDFLEPRSESDQSPNLAVRAGSYKLLVNADGSRAELYDLMADPTETTDLTRAKPDVARHLSHQVLTGRTSLPLPGDISLERPSTNSWRHRPNTRSSGTSRATPSVRPACRPA